MTLTEALDHEPERRDLAWRLGVNLQVTNAAICQTELPALPDRPHEEPRQPCMTACPRVTSHRIGVKLGTETAAFGSGAPSFASGFTSVRRASSAAAAGSGGTM